ncbi:LssY C-terminal domain-containing protein [Lysinibacter cavernae]|uniref:LssY-like C-terminal domain-containing protein n=1 Tax=Lysinibacter cavernae TaxID=1640652 RepID=A0A7X5R2B1_9MICO|nr:LssY C-terminal domain-containing protein [Lysinibacter cavernae]NIH54080.1 hypothetical protein [Lysinibacter cavernae]
MPQTRKRLESAGGVTSAPEKLPAAPSRSFTVTRFFDNAFFIFAGVASVWLAWLVLSEGWSWGWGQIWFYLLFWVVLAYLVLPRLHRILTEIYVPNYFIGRARTSDGLLGDPVNLALTGSGEQIHEVLKAAGWTRADEVTAASSWRIITSTILRRSYDEAPVSPLFLFGHKQDFAYQQEVEGNPARRHHVRFWKCPEGWMLPGGHQADWLAAGTFDRSVGFSLFTLQITHKIDADTDVERDHIVASMMQANGSTKVRVIKDFSTGYHSRNGGGDSITTDGDLPVIDVNLVEVSEPDADAPSDVAELTADTPKSAAIVKRPISTILGAALVFFSALSGFAYATGILLTWDQYRDSLTVLLDDPDLDSTEILNFTVATIVVMSLLGGIFELVFGTLLFRGSSWVRVWLMSVSAFGVVFQAIDFMTGGPSITLSNNLLQVSLYILILVALSSRSARDYARRPRS